MLILVACRCRHPQSWLHHLNLAHEESLERAGSVIPPQTFAVPVPQLEAVLLFSILIPELENICQVKIYLLSRAMTMKACLSNFQHPLVPVIVKSDKIKGS